MTVVPVPTIWDRGRQALAMPEQSPLDYFRFSVPRLRDALRLFVGDDPVDELACRAANKGAKTYNLAAYVLACLQKRRELDGVPLPQWQGPVVGLCLVLDHEQQKLSVQKHILKLLGKWPVKLTWKGQGILGEVKIMPVNGSDDMSTWSTLTIMSQKNQQTGVGARADIVWADEPPNEMIWREVRKAADAGRRIIRPLGFTPTIRRQWAWIRDEYGDTPRNTTKRITRDWAECRWSLFDNTALSEAEVAKLLREYKRDALYDARVYGDYANEAGECPFDVDTIERMLLECVEPTIVQWRVPVESDDGVPHERIVIPVEVWEQPEPGESYVCPIDPSAGIEDSRHDPAGLHIRKIGSGHLVVLCVGAIRPYSLGVLAAGLARAYNNSVILPEVNDGFGMTVLTGIRDSRYGNIGHEMRELTDGKWAKEMGFRTTHASRAAMIGAIQGWLESYRAGVRYARCPSRKVLECLLDCVLDESGKPIAAPGAHDEDLILWGVGLRKAVTRSGRHIPDIEPKPRTLDDELIALINGQDDSAGAPFGQVAAAPRPRPRI